MTLWYRRASMKKLALGAWLLVAVACGPTSRVGQPCTVKADCEGGQSCYTSLPGGFCSKGCTFQGATVSECPNGTVCTQLGTGNQQICAPVCDDAADCRAEYDCKAVTGSASSACQPR